MSVIIACYDMLARSGCADMICGPEAEYNGGGNAFCVTLAI